MIATALTDLWYGFGVAVQPHNIMWCFIGVLVGNMVGVLPGMGPLKADQCRFYRAVCPVDCIADLRSAARPQERHCDSASARVHRIVRSVTAHGALPLP